MNIFLIFVFEFKQKLNMNDWKLCWMTQLRRRNNNEFNWVNWNTCLARSTTLRFSWVNSSRLLQVVGRKRSRGKWVPWIVCVTRCARWTNRFTRSPTSIPTGPTTTCARNVCVFIFTNKRICAYSISTNVSSVPSRSLVWQVNNTLNT